MHSVEGNQIFNYSVTLRITGVRFQIQKLKWQATHSPQIAELQQGKYLVKAFHEQQQGHPQQQYDASEQKLDHALLS